MSKSSPNHMIRTAFSYLRSINTATLALATLAAPPGPSRFISVFDLLPRECSTVSTTVLPLDHFFSAILCERANLLTLCLSVHPNEIVNKETTKLWGWSKEPLGQGGVAVIGSMFDGRIRQPNKDWMIRSLFGQSFSQITPSRLDQKVSFLLQTFYFSGCYGTVKRFSGNIVKSAAKKISYPTFKESAFCVQILIFLI